MNRLQKLRDHFAEEHMIIKHWLPDNELTEMELLDKNGVKAYYLEGWYKCTVQFDSLITDLETRLREIYDEKGGKSVLDALQVIEEFWGNE